jgi:hypothetical protein
MLDVTILSRRADAKKEPLSRSEAHQSGEFYSKEILKRTIAGPYTKPFVRHRERARVLTPVARGLRGGSLPPETSGRRKRNESVQHA